MASDGFLWVKQRVIYQIYPRSFMDSNGDGIGDIPGITMKLDYLSSLGVDAIWLSPVNRSPMFDFGYDISDYRDIDPIFGTLADFDTLIEEAHRKNIRLVMDMVMNHTSHLHPWFLESRSSPSNPKRDWYIWRDGKADALPTTGCQASADRPRYDEETGQYYLHLLSGPAARRELAQSRTERGHVRRDPLLAGTRRGRLQAGCGELVHEG
jgi:alpha-glucosidase